MMGPEQLMWQQLTVHEAAEIIGSHVGHEKRHLNIRLTEGCLTSVYHIASLVYMTEGKLHCLGTTYGCVGPRQPIYDLSFIIMLLQLVGRKESKYQRS